MIILGIDPGTAALGYGIIERTGGRLREVDHGCLVTSPDLPLPERLRRFADLGALPVADAERDLFDRGAQHRQRAQHFRMAIARHDLVLDYDGSNPCHAPGNSCWCARLSGVPDKRSSDPPR